MARTKRSETETYVALRIPRELHARLKEAGGERGLTAEITRRLETSISTDPASARDPKTKRLLNAIDAVAWSIQPALGWWHEKPEAFKAITAAIETLLDYFEPDAATPFNERLHARLTGPGTGPAIAVGASFATHQLGHGQGGEVFR